MSTADAWIFGANDGAPRPDDGWSSRTRFTLSDFVVLLWKQRFLMAAIFVVIFAAGIAYALTLHTTYSANSQILVRLGPHDVYVPPAGDAARGATTELKSVVGNELAILTAGPVLEGVADRIGPHTIYPDIEAGTTPAERAKAKTDAVKGLVKGFKYDSTPDQGIIRLSFEHDNPDMAARVLNAIMDEYLIYRRTVVSKPLSPAIGAELARSEAELSQADSSLQAFLILNDIGDFESEKAAMAQTLTVLEQQRYTAENALQERRARLTALNTALAGLPAESVTSRDENRDAQKALDDKLLERATLAARYLPGTPPMVEIDGEIADLRRQLATLPPPGDAARRVGPNPTYQITASERITVQADIQSRTAELGDVTRQIADVTRRQLELANLEPEYRGLIRDQALLQENTRQFGQRELESLSTEALERLGPTNISIVNPAAAPSEGSSKRKLIAALALLLAGFTALCVGLLRIFLEPGLPTAASAGRTLDLPVLATARMKA